MADRRSTYKTGTLTTGMVSVQNLVWAMAHNVAAIPLAAGVIRGHVVFVMNPAVAATLMSLSTVIVAAMPSLSEGHKTVPEERQSSEFRVLGWGPGNLLTRSRYHAKGEN